MSKRKLRWLRQPGLRKNWFKSGDIEATLKNMIRIMDRTWVLLQNPDGFAEGLIDELRFIACYSEREQKKVQKYVEAHKGELYKFAQKATKFYPKYNKRP